MKLGLHIYDFSWPGGASQIGPTLVKIAQTADTWGFDRISVGDHVWQSPYLGGPEREVLSCYPTLAYLCAHTSRIKPISMATAAPYWQPVLLALSKRGAFQGDHHPALCLPQGALLHGLLGGLLGGHS